MSKEKHAELFIETEFLHKMARRDGWNFEKQCAVSDTKKRIDYIVDAGGLKFGIECKAKLVPGSDGMKAAALASHFEQAAAYARALEMPVFIGPVIWYDNPSSAVAGGWEMSSLAALNLFGGRVNVGTLIYHIYGNGRTFWTLSLRGQSFWKPDYGFSTKVNKLVTSTGSKKERRDLCQM